MKMGFNLIELVTVIAIIGILASIVIPNIGSMQARALKTEVQSNVRNIQVAVDHFSMERQGAVPTAETPTVNIPQEIDFLQLGEEFLRSRPREGATYWVDFSGRVWASTVKFPEGVAVSAGGVVSWVPVDGAVRYIVYEVTSESRGYGVSVAVETLETSFAGLPGRKYIVSAVDTHGLETAPSGTGLGGSMPTAVIGMSSDPEILTSTRITWSFDGSIAPAGRTITSAEWRLNNGPVLDTPPVSGLLAGVNSMALRVKDSNEMWSPWVQREFSAELAQWDTLSSGSHTLAIRNGQLWSWGQNWHGTLGLGNRVSQDTPQRVGLYSDWTDVSASWGHSLAIRGGQLFAWGRGSGGALGLGDQTDRLVPTLVDSRTDWQTVSAGGNLSSFAIRNGELYSWGSGSAGSLGQGPVSRLLIPTRIGVLSDWTDVSSGNGHSVALRNGELWSWGINTNGRLGLGDQVHRDVPTRIGILSDWASISSGWGHVLAIRNGELWTWGVGSDSQLGHGDTFPRLSPTRVGTHSDWDLVSAGEFHSLAIRNGELWAWGLGNASQLGFANTVTHPSPVLLPSPHNWTHAFGGVLSSFGIRGSELLTWGHASDDALGLGHGEHTPIPPTVLNHP